MPLTSRSRWLHRLLPALLGAALLLALAGCGNSQDPLAIIGTYTDNYGGTHVITAATWTQSGTGYSDVFHILGYSNGLMFLLAQNDPANAYNGGLYSRFRWTVHGGQLYYCQDPYNAVSEDAARDAPAENDSDPANRGCGASDFAWTQLIPQ